MPRRHPQDFQRESAPGIADEYGRSPEFRHRRDFEEIVGEIDDEFDTAQKEIMKTLTGWRINGLIAP